MAVNKKLRFYIIYFLLMFGLTILLIEMASAFVLKTKDQGTNTQTSSRHVFHPYRSHALNPDYVREKDSSGKKLHSDDGFRSDSIINKDKPDDVYRIIMLGGSTLYGISASGIYPFHPTLNNDETVSHFLQQKLSTHPKIAASNKKIEVINAGVTAYTTFHNLVYFNEVLYEYNPDLVVFLDGHNDFYYYEVYNNWQLARQGTPSMINHFNHRTGWYSTLSLVRFFAKYSKFFMLVEKYMLRSWKALPYDQFPQSGIRANIESTFPENVDQVLRETILKSYVQFNALGKLFDFDIIVFLQPEITLEKDELLSPADKHLKQLTSEHESNTRRHEIRPYFAELFEKYEIPFVDMGEIATQDLKSEQLYIDYCHLTPRGADVVATNMLSHIVDIVR